MEGNDTQDDSLTDPEKFPDSLPNVRLNRKQMERC